MITAGTLHKKHFFRDRERLDLIHASLLDLTEEYGWLLQAWAVFSNHYHFVAVPSDRARDLGVMIGQFHSNTSRDLNKLDGIEKRQVWFQYWDTRLTFQKSYMARLQYTHQNAVRHGLVLNARDYPWCSAGWLERTATPAFLATLASFKTDQIKILDEFDPILDE